MVPRIRFSSQTRRFRGVQLSLLICTAVMPNSNRQLKLPGRGGRAACLGPYRVEDARTSYGRRVIHFADSNWSPYWSYAYFYCDESKLPKKDGKSRACNSSNNHDKRVIAYTFSDDGHWYRWNAKHVVFCPRFFDDDILTLAQMVADGWRDSTLQKIMDPWRKVKARVVYRSKRII
ncbi:hypothetical protein V8E54_009732 [Elaphomyces granulatus]